MDFPSGLATRASFNPKYVHYGPNGCGRDSYIICNNGGLIKSDIQDIPHLGFVPKKLSTSLFINQPSLSFSGPSPR